MYNTSMRLLNGLFDYNIFAKSTDQDLIDFCNYFVKYKNTNEWNEDKFTYIVEKFNGQVVETLSLSHLLSTVTYMRHEIYLLNICEIIQTFREYSHTKVIESLNGGSVVIKDFKKVDFSIDGRINTIISLLEESL